VSREARFGYAGALLITAALALMALQFGGCGASARQTALKGAYATTSAAHAEFDAWDLAHRQAIRERATSLDEGLRELRTYYDRRRAVDESLIAAYSLIGAAMDGDVDLPAVMAAVAAVERAVRSLRGGP